MEADMRQQDTSVPQTGFFEKSRVKERVSEKLSPFNGDISDWIPWETHTNTVFGFNGWENVENQPNPITIHDSENTIKINESIFWSLQLAL